MSNPKGKPYYNGKNWLYGAVSGINGKRYSVLPVANYEVNDDGTITAYGGTYPIQTDSSGREYFDVEIPESQNRFGLQLGFNHLDSSGNLLGRGITFNRYPVGKHLPVTVEEHKQGPIVQLPVLQVTLLPVKQQQKAKPIVRRVEIPESLRRGLATIKNGTPYYNIPADPETVTQILATLPSAPNNGDRPYYTVPLEKPKLNNLQLNNLQLTTVQNHQQPFITEGSDAVETEIIQVPDDYDDDAAIFYKYPRRHVHVYDMDPGVALYVLDELQRRGKSPWLKLKNTTDKEFVFVDKPLNIESANDTTFHKIYKTAGPEQEFPWLYLNYSSVEERNDDFKRHGYKNIGNSLYRHVHNRKLFEDAVASGDIVPVGTDLNVISSSEDGIYGEDGYGARRIPGTTNTYLISNDGVNTLSINLITSGTDATNNIPIGPLIKPDGTRTNFRPFDKRWKDPFSRRLYNLRDALDSKNIYSWYKVNENLDKLEGLFRRHKSGGTINYLKFYK